MTAPVRRFCLRPAGVLVCAGLVLCAGCGSGDSTGTSSEPSLTPAESVRIQTQVMTFCGACHGPPQPDSFPRDAWYHEIELAYRLFHESGRQDLVAPPMADVVRWYRSQAPEQLPLRATDESPSPIRFRRQAVAGSAGAAGSDSGRGPGVAHFRRNAGLDRNAALPNGAASWFFCDMSRNGLFRLSVDQPEPVIELLQPARNPVHLEVCDLNADGRQDYLLCEMGSLLPEDHDRGRLLWFEDLEAGSAAPLVLVENVGRVVDARPGDFDRDGDLDLIVAVFGWRKTGQLLFLEQTSRDNGVPRFRTRQLDDRHGVIHVPAVDLDSDGDLDFVALFSQEHETIEAFLNRGDGTFERQIVSLTGSPSYGSSGMELVDFDADGDVDILYTNGDTLDSSLLKPYHSVQWLENAGDFPFTRHHIDWLPGAYRAVPADMDGDGDLDVVTAAWIPENAEPASPRADGLYATVVWHEQLEADTFATHVLATAPKNGCMTLDVGDLNGDGRPDVVAGWFADSGADPVPWIEIFWNSGGTEESRDGDAAPAR